MTRGMSKGLVHPKFFVDFGTTRESELDKRKDLTGVYS